MVARRYEARDSTRQRYLILIHSTDGSDPARLTNQGTVNQMASFSPDGTQIAFLSNREGYGSVFIMNSDGSGDQVNFTPKPLGYPGTWTSRAPAWSPDGQYIYFTAQRSIETGNLTEQIYVKPTGGGDETKLTSAGANSEATVRRVNAPTITSVLATPNVLWPANNNMVPVSLAVDVTDNSDPARLPYHRCDEQRGCRGSRLADHRSPHARSSRTAIWNGCRSHIHHYSHLH